MTLITSVPLYQARSDSESLFEELTLIPFLDSAVLIQQLKDKLPKYLALALDVDPSLDTCTFWRNHSDTLPFWSTVASKLATIQPSSSSAERAFSLLNSFNL